MNDDDDTRRSVFRARILAHLLRLCVRSLVRWLTLYIDLSVVTFSSLGFLFSTSRFQCIFSHRIKNAATARYCALV